MEIAANPKKNSTMTNKKNENVFKISFISKNCLFLCLSKMNAFLKLKLKLHIFKEKILCTHSISLNIFYGCLKIGYF